MKNKKVSRFLSVRLFRNDVFICLIIIILSLPAILPLLHPGFFVSDDGEWMIIRFSAFHQALVRGQFPVRFLPRLNYEYGYPVTDFLYPGFLYLAEPFHLLKFGFVSSVKIILGLSLIGSAIFVYLWLTKTFSKIGALFGAVVYLYMPYHIYDVYQRGSVGEVLALAVVPLILYSLEKQKTILAALGIGLLSISHNTLAALFFPLIVLYAISRRNILFYVPIFILGIGLAAFFWIPALYDLQYTVFSQTKISNYSQYFAGINLIGWTSVVVLLGAGIILFLIRSGFTKNLDIFNKPHLGHLLIGEGSSPVLYLFLLIGAVSVFFSISLSKVFWQFLPVSFIQFPFRLLSVTILADAFLVAYIFTCLKKKILQVIFAVVICILVFVDCSSHFKAIQFTNKGEGFYATNEDTTTVKDEYMPKWVKLLPSERPTNLFDTKNISITQLHNTGSRISFTTDAAKASQIIVNMIYFPGWQAKVDNMTVPILHNYSRGLISFIVPSGNHQVYVWFGETPIRLISDLITIICLIILLLLTLRVIKKGEMITSDHKKDNIP